jgi:hypothetical protein
MPRRASSKINPLWFVAIALLVAAAIGGGFLFFKNFNDPLRTVGTLDVALYLENANSLRGNTYRVLGTVWNSLGWSPAAGRLFAVEAGENRATELLPVLVPSQLNHVNLQKGQRFIFEVEVIDGGVLRVRSLRKE